MEPLRKALRLPRVTLFIADDTGLGKTIEAGLIARELLLRKKAKTIVVAAPPSVLEQWKAELEERFGLVFEILDRAYLTRMRRERGFASTRGAPTAASSCRTTSSATRPTRTPCASGSGRSSRAAS
jgi:SNF2 family DNA or RNA helicase